MVLPRDADSVADIKLGPVRIDDSGTPLLVSCPSCGTTKLEAGPKAGDWAQDFRCENGHDFVYYFAFREGELL